MKVNNKLSKLIKYYNLINHNLIFSENAINRCKKRDFKNETKNLTQQLNNLERTISEIKNCSLKDYATKMVFSDGNPNSKIMIIGEGPGANEDKEGLPFVGRAGQLLDKMLAAIDRSRENDVFICNVLKCRPPENRDPKSDEINQCEPYLVNQIDLIKPKLIVALGRIAGKTLLGVDKSLKDMRKKIHNYHDSDLIVTYHPAALLRNPNWKPYAWEDFKWIRSILEEV